MKSVALNAFPRTLARRAGAKRLRASGRIPAIIYGRQAQPQNLEVSAKEMENLIHHSISENLLVDLAVKDDARPKRLALVQEVQHHPLSGEVLHVDLHEVAENEKVTVNVPLETVGEAVGVKTGGGVLEHVLFKIKVCALPKDLPEQIIVDVTSLELGKSIHLGDLKAPADVEMIKEKKEEGEEAAPAKGEKAGAKGAEKGAAKGAEKAGAKPGEKAPAAAAAGDKKAAAPAEKKK